MKQLLIVLGQYIRAENVSFPFSDASPGSIGQEFTDI